MCKAAIAAKAACKVACAMLPQLPKCHVPHCCFAKVLCTMLPQLLKWHVLQSSHIAETAHAMLLQLLKRHMLHFRIAEAAHATLPYGC